MQQYVSGADSAHPGDSCNGQFKLVTHEGPNGPPARDPPAATHPSVRSAAVPPWKRAVRHARPSTRPERGELVTPAAHQGLSLRDEKILLTLVVQTQQINDRLTRLEDRFEASVRDALDQPDQQDLLELRLHSARLAAELSRVTVELRAEINELAAGLAGATGADDIAPPKVTERLAGDADEYEAMIDLREPEGRARATTSPGWRPSRAPRRAPDTE
jgi:hypothetical protein